VPTATCDFRFSLQNRHADDTFVDELAEFGISNRAVTISGRATMSEKGISRADFIDAKAGRYAQSWRVSWTSTTSRGTTTS
jgi:hypothetical protein